MDVFLIRHGQSYNNALEDLSDRVPDPPLTEMDAKQAERVAAHLSGGGHVLESERSGNDRPFLDELYCSPMVRALETARQPCLSPATLSIRTPETRYCRFWTGRGF